MKKMRILSKSNITQSAETSTKKGYIVDFITGRLLRETKEEPVRQAIEHMLVEDYGYSKNQISIEFKIQRGSKKGNEEADIVVFNDSKNKDQMNALIVVETEHPGVDFDNQLISYVTATTAPFCIWANGEKTLLFYRDPKNPTVFDPIPEIPRIGETIDDIGRHLKNQLKPAHNLKMLFENIHNQLYATANIKRPEELGREMTKILFCKIFDEKDSDPKCQFRATVDEIMDDNGKSKIVHRLKKIFDYVKDEYSDVFDQSDKINLDNDSLVFIVSKLQQISLMKSDTDTVGKSFEVFVPEELKGEKGEFFTPRPVVRMAVNIISPDPMKKEKILDPSCGSGGFLTMAMEKIREILDQKYKMSHLTEHQIEKIKSDYIGKNFYGIDIEQDLVRISKAYMAIVGDGRSGIFRADSLTDPQSWPDSMKEKLKLDTFDVILTNPPFGKKIPITKKNTLQQFDLGKEVKKAENGEIRFTSKIRKSQVPNILFLERCVKFLKAPTNGENGGRLGIVLPRGTLNNPDILDDKACRKWIFENTRILGVIDLPEDTFQPYTGTTTSLVLLQRTDSEPDDDYDVFMAISKKIGHDKRGNPKFKQDAHASYIVDKNGQMILDIDADDIVEDFKKYTSGTLTDTNRSFTVKYSEIKKADRIDASHFNPEATRAKMRIKSSLPKGWSLKTVGSVTKEVFYPGRFRRPYVDKEYGIPFISGANITRLQKVGMKYISNKMKKLSDYLVKKDWIFVTRSGTSGIVVYADESYDGVAVSEHVIRVVPDPEKIDAGYLYAILSSPIFEPIFESAITGSVVDEITPDFIKKMEIPIPNDIKVQKKIGDLIREAEKNISLSAKSLKKAQDSIDKFIKK
jgi:type I restriction enzyme M protein